MITNPKVGQRVKVVQLEPYYSLPIACLDQTGVITEIISNPHYANGIYMRVGFPRLMGMRQSWCFQCEHLVAAFMTPEEEAHFMDQQRREAYADKYP